MSWGVMDAARRRMQSGIIVCGNIISKLAFQVIQTQVSLFSDRLLCAGLKKAFDALFEFGFECGSCRFFLPTSFGAERVERTFKAFFFPSL